MSTSVFHDPRASDLLSRVNEDVSLLRQDVGRLFSHAARHTLPGGARNLADSAKNQLAAGRTSAAEHLRALREHTHQPAAWVGGAVALGLIAAGLYWCCRDGACDGSPQDA